MEYIKTKDKDSYFKEMAGICFQGNRLIKDPQGEAKLFGDNIKVPFLFLFAALVMLIWMTVELILEFNALGLRLVIALCAFLIWIGRYFYAYYSLINMFKKNYVEALSIECDADGLTQVVPSGTKTVFWNSIQGVRLFKYTMAFVPKEKGVPFMMLPIENLENITAFLKENEIDLPIIRK